MRYTQRASAELEQTATKLENEQSIDLELDDVADLLVEPEVAPFQPRRSPHRSGVEHLAQILASVERLPEALTVRLHLPSDHSRDVSAGVAEASLRSRAADMADESWREAMAIRSMGRRQLPLGIGVGIGAAVLAYVAAYLASVAETGAARGAWVVVAAISLTIAWVVGWVVVEAAILDWRLPARQAAACGLLEKATLEIAYDAEPQRRSGRQ